MLPRLWLCLALFVSPAYGMETPPAEKKDQRSHGSLAPEFRLPLTSGKTQSLTETMDGKKTVIFFWTTWCPHCRNGLLQMRDQAATFEEQGIRILLVNLGEPAAQVKEYLQQIQVDWDCFLDTDNALPELYGIQGVPTLFFVDSDGTLITMTHQFPENYAEIFSS